MGQVGKKKWALTRSNVIQLALVLFDAVAVNLAYYMALVIRFYVNNAFNEWAARYVPEFWKFVPYYTVFCLIVFSGFRLYTRRWKYASTEDLNRILMANIVTCVGHVAGTLLITTRMPLTYYGLGAIIQLALIVGSRLSFRMVMLEVERSKARRRSSEPLKKVMVIGVGETAHQVLRHMEHDLDGAMKPVCMIDFREYSFGTMMEGIPVVGGVDAIAGATKTYEVESVILADTTMPGAVRKRVREICDELNLEVQDYVGYFQESWGSMTLSTMVAYATSEVELVINGVHRKCANGKQAAKHITEHHAVKAMYVKNNRLVIELQTPLALMYITNDPTVAQIAEKNGVQRVWIDLETLGKEERQRNLNTVKSHHCIHDIEVISNVLTTSEVLVRVNPINPGSEEEINQVIAAGADMVMLPMWKSVEDVKQFLSFVNGRVKTTLLLETKEAVECLDQVLELGGFDEIHIGLDDLHLSYGLTFMFELLSNGTVESLCKKIAATGIPYGFGGIARIGDGTLPAEWIVKEHYRLGSTRAILSRSFCNAEEIKDLKKIEVIFAENMARLRDCERDFTTTTEEDFEENRKAVKRKVADIVAKKKAQAAK